MREQSLLSICSQCKTVYKDEHDFKKYWVEEDGCHGYALCDYCGSDEMYDLARHNDDFFNCEDCGELIIQKVKHDSYVYVDCKYICLECWLKEEDL